MSDMRCEVCRILFGKQDVVLLQTPYWRVALAPDQLYLGRAYVTLLRHCGSLAELTSVELLNWQVVVSRYESLVRRVFGAELFNWGCLLNDAFRERIPRPHVHWHVRPRYRNEPTIDRVAYPDPNFGCHYERDQIRIVSAAVRARIGDLLRMSS